MITCIVLAVHKPEHAAGQILGALHRHAQTSLHLHIGELNLSSLLAVEYGFHLIGMIAGVIRMSFFLVLLRQRNMPEK